MKNKQLIVIYCSIAVFILLLLGVAALFIWFPKNVTDYNADILQWTRIGAIGGWIGSIFGAIALIVSLIALLLPMKRKLDAKAEYGYFLDQSLSKTYELIVITVKNTGSKPATINNIHVNFDEHDGFLFVGLLAENTPAFHQNPRFPVRLEEGSSVDYYIPKEKFVEYLKKEVSISPYSKFQIIVDEVIDGKQYYNTKWTKQSIIEK